MSQSIASTTTTPSLSVSAYPLPKSTSSKNPSARLLPVLLPLSLLAGAALLVNSVRPWQQSQPQAVLPTQPQAAGPAGLGLANAGFAGHCQHIGIHVSSTAFRPVHQRGAFASDSSFECLNSGL